MPQTPENLQIDVNPNYNAQAPQVDLTVVKPTFVAEGEVSNPTPDQWIGPVNYGMNWYALGSAGFKVAGNIYENVLDYNVQKKVGQINDLQFDLETKMRNSYSESFTKPENFSETPTMESYEAPFENSDKFQQEYIEQTNEILGIGSRDESGKYINVFQPDYNLEGLGTKYIQAVTMARDGLKNVAATSQNVQKDLLETARKSLDISDIMRRYQNNDPINETDSKKLAPYMSPISSGSMPIPVPVIDPNAKAGDGSSIVKMGKDGQYYFTSNVNKNDMLKVVGEDGLKNIYEYEASNIGMATRGVNLPPGFAEETFQTVATDNPSPAQVIKIQTYLKYASPEKLRELMITKKDLTVLQQAKLIRLWGMSGYNTGIEEPRTTNEVIVELSKITDPDAAALMQVRDTLTGRPINTSNAMAVAAADRKLETAKAVFAQQYSDLFSATEITDITGNNEQFQNYITNNQNMLPSLLNGVLLYDNILRTSNNDTAAAQQAVKLQGTNSFRDAYGNIYSSRASSTIRITDYHSNMKQAIGQNKASDPTSVDPNFELEFNKKNKQQTVFAYGVLQNSIYPQSFENGIKSVDSSGLVPVFEGDTSQFYFTTKERIDILSSIGTLKVDSSITTKEPVTQAEFFRISLATNPSIIRYFNNGKDPVNKENAIQRARQAYAAIGPAESWDWKDKSLSSLDQFSNSSNGGISFGLSSLMIKKQDGTTIDLLKDKTVARPSSANYLMFTDTNTGNPIAFIPNSIVSDRRFQSELEKNFTRLSRGLPAKEKEILTGSKSITSSTNTNLIATAQHLEQTSKEDTYTILSRVTNSLDTTAVEALVQTVSWEKAQGAMNDPVFLHTVAASLSKSYNIPIEDGTKMLYEIVSDTELKNTIALNDVNEDGQLQKIDLFVNLHNAVLGYKNNKIRTNTTDENISWLGIGPDGKDLLGDKTGNVSTSFWSDQQDIKTDWADGGARYSRFTNTYDPKTDTLSVEGVEQTKDFNTTNGKFSTIGDGSFGKPAEGFGKPVSPGAIRGSNASDFISNLEGFRTDAYWDKTGWAVGNGSRTKLDGTPVKEGDKVTKEQATIMLNNYVDTVRSKLETSVPTWNELNTNQQDALISFGYNVGPDFYGKKDFETITKALSTVNTLKTVPEALKLYKKSGGKVLNGLINRRKAEVDLWNKPIK